MKENGKQEFCNVWKYDFELKKKKNFGREFHVEMNEKEYKMVDEEGLRKEEWQEERGKKLRKHRKRIRERKKKEKKQK